MNRPLLRIDRYLLGQFLGTYALFMVLIMAIAVVFDISQKIDNFLNQDITIGFALQHYYGHFILYYGSTFSALILFLSTVYATARLANRSELMAILAGGLPFQRLLLPFALGAGIVFIFMMLLSHFVVPQSNIARLAFEDRYVQDVAPKRPINIHRQILPGHYIYLETWSPERKAGYHFSYEVFDGSKLVSKLRGDYLRYDTVAQTWKLDNWERRTFADQSMSDVTLGRTLDSNFAFKPTLLNPDQRRTETMTSPQLLRFLAQERLSGSEAVVWHEAEWYRRTAYPFSMFILVVMAFSLSSAKRRGGLGAPIALGLLFVVVYIFFMQLGSMSMMALNTPPLLAIWLPNLVFGTLTIYLYQRAPK
jgi:lipopolysaccharide export system permease protein